MRHDDLDTVHRLLSNFDVVRYMRFPLCSREESEKFVRESIDEPPSDPYISVVRVITGGAATDDLIGLCGIVQVRGTAEGELWYLLDPVWWGQGVTPAAAREMLGFAFNDMSLHRIWATVVPVNTASARVLEKIGMRREGHLVKNELIHGQWTSTDLFAILDDEWSRATTLAGS